MMNFTLGSFISIFILILSEICWLIFTHLKTIRIKNRMLFSMQGLIFWMKISSISILELRELSIIIKFPKWDDQNLVNSIHILGLFFSSFLTSSLTFKLLFVITLEFFSMPFIIAVVVQLPCITYLLWVYF